MSVIVRTPAPDSEEVRHERGSYTDIGAQGELLIYDEKDVEVAVHHRDHWAFTRIEETVIDVEDAPSDTKINRLAQTFYEASGLSLQSMTDKPLIVRGLQAVFAQLRAETQPVSS